MACGSVQNGPYQLHTSNNALCPGITLALGLKWPHGQSNPIGVFGAFHTEMHHSKCHSKRLSILFGKKMEFHVICDCLDSKTVIGFQREWAKNQILTGSLNWSVPLWMSSLGLSPSLSWKHLVNGCLLCSLFAVNVENKAATSAHLVGPDVCHLTVNVHSLYHYHYYFMTSEWFYCELTPKQCAWRYSICNLFPPPWFLWRSVSSTQPSSPPFLLWLFSMAN